MAYPRHHTIDHYLNKVRVHDAPYEAEVLGKKIVIYPNVMSPKYDRSAQIFIGMMPGQADKTFLDMGCGSGVVGLFAALNGAKEVIAVDINERAVANTAANFASYGLQNAKAIESDLFEKVEGKFDTIFFNAPFHGNEPKDLLERGTSDPDYQTLKQFFEQANNYLCEGGQVLLGFADMGDNELLRRLAQENHLSIVDLKTQENGNWTAYLYILSPIK